MKNISEENIVTELSKDHEYLKNNIASLVKSSKDLSLGVDELNFRLSKKEIISYDIHQLIYLLLSNYLMINHKIISYNKPNKETVKFNNALGDAYEKITKIIESDKFIEFVKNNLMRQNKNQDDITKKSLENILKFIKAYEIKNDLTSIIEKSLEGYEQDDAEEKEDRSREKKNDNRRKSEKQETTNQGIREYRYRESGKQETTNQGNRYPYLEKVLKGNQRFNEQNFNKNLRNKLTRTEPGKE
jgi:hypothetical protein